MVVYLQLANEIEKAVMDSNMNVTSMDFDTSGINIFNNII